MKINFADYDFTGLQRKVGSFCGQDAILVTPEIVPPVWTQKNKIFRSSIWSLNGDLMSGSFVKFTNAFENPENFPMPTSIDGCIIADKIDGSCVCCDYINGQFSMRTRGTFTYKTLENSADFDYCLNKYPKIVDFIKGRPYLSLLFEITTPNVKIVIDYGDEPDFTLIGAVDKTDYNLLKQHELDLIGHIIGVKRPEYFTFNNLNDLISIVKADEEREGVCLYSADGQTIHKIKADKYLKLHYFKSQLSFKSIKELWLAQDCPSKEEFEKFIESQFDWECLQVAKINLDELYTIIDKINGKINAVSNFIKLRELNNLSRKEMAQIILDKYGKTVWSGVAFTILSGKGLNNKTWKNLIDESYKSTNG